MESHRVLRNRSLSQENKPDTIEELRATKEQLAEERFFLEEAIDAELGFSEIIGQSKALKEVLSRVTIVGQKQGHGIGGR